MFPTKTITSGSMTIVCSVCFVHMMCFFTDNQHQGL